MLRALRTEATSVRVLAWPAYANRHTNPYNSNLYSAMESMGAVVSEFSHRALLIGSFDVLHVHWPDAKLSNRSTLKASLRASGLLVLLALVRLRGKAIVWTVHNLRQHENLHPRLERAYMRGFTRLLSGWIALTETGAREAVEVHPSLGRTPRVIAPIGHFDPQVKRRRSVPEAREEARLPSGPTVIGTFGRLRRYKNVEELIEAFRGCPADWRLLIACDPVDRAYADSLRSAAEDPRITMTMKDLTDRELEVLVQSMDLVVLPYRAILNSASLLYALSCGRPTLVPDVPTLKEVADSVGGNAVSFYRPPLSADALKRAVASAPAPQAFDLSAFDWTRIGALTLEFFQQFRRR